MSAKISVWLTMAQFQQRSQCRLATGSQLIAQQYLTITWNYASGTVLQAGASQTVTITINVNQYVTGINTITNTIYIIAAQSSYDIFSFLFVVRVTLLAINLLGNNWR